MLSLTVRKRGIMSKRFLLVIVLILAVIGGIIWVSGDKADAPTNGNGSTQVTNHTFGDGGKGVTLIEYGDFECPACGAYYPFVKQLKEELKADIIFQFRNFPLTQHQNAFAAHRAAEAADKQGKFWEMHDLLYEGQKSWESRFYSQSDAIRTFEGYASQLGLNMEQYKTDRDSSEVNNIINADIKAGQAVGAASTPTFVLNGRKIEENPRDYEAFKKLIQDEINAKNPTQ